VQPLPDSEMKRGARAGTPHFISSQPKDVSQTPDERQTRRVARLYDVSFATAATIAEVAYAVAR
jgi:hypothetical protein